MWVDPPIHTRPRHYREDIVEDVGRTVSLPSCFSPPEHSLSSGSSLPPPSGINGGILAGVVACVVVCLLLRRRKKRKRKVGIESGLPRWGHLVELEAALASEFRTREARKPTKGEALPVSQTGAH